MSNYESRRTGRKRGHNSGVARQRKANRRADAHTRMAYRLLRSPAEQLRLLDQRPGLSAKERGKIKEQQS